MDLKKRLATREKDFDAEIGLYGARLEGIGYHTTLPDGAWVHHTRRNLTHAHELLSSGETQWIERGRSIIRKIISLQDQNPVSPTYGIWSWHFEESLDEMAPPDWNWADFLGLKLAEILHDYTELLPLDLKEEIKESLGHAAKSIFRRNVGAHYTNIAIKGGCVAVTAGEVLGEKWLIDYGRIRLQSVIEHYHTHGGFNEYNSPTYTRLVISICETAWRILHDEQARTSIQRLHYVAWQTLAEHYHPATKQLAGPQSRAYHNFLEPDFLDFISCKVGSKTQQATSELMCPIDLAERFHILPEGSFESKHQYIWREQGHPTTGLTWFNGEVSLGSISHDTTWNQRRPLLGYWLNADEQSVSLRLRVLRNGKDFASGFVWNAQREAKALTVTNFINDGGDFHPFFDRPANGVFQTDELCVCYELYGEGVSAKMLDSKRFELTAGHWRAVVHAGASYFNGVEVEWHLIREEKRCCVVGKLSIEEGQFDVTAQNEIIIASAVEIITQEQPPSESHIEIVSHPDDSFTATWSLEGNMLLLNAPISPLPQDKTHNYGKVEALEFQQKHS